MAVRVGMKLPGDQVLDDQGVIWSPMPKQVEWAEGVERDGKWYFPTRRIRTAEELRQEIESAGFVIRTLELNLEEDDPWSFDALCGKR